MKYSEIQKMNGRSASSRKYFKTIPKNLQEFVLEGFLVCCNFLLLHSALCLSNPFDSDSNLR